MIKFLKKLLKLFFDIKEETPKVETKSPQQRTYTKKRIMTETELKFYNRLKKLLPNGYIIFPQINLQSIIDIEENPRFKNELFRNIDFGVFDENTLDLEFLIELNDHYHNTNNKTKSRDKKVKTLLKQSGYQLTTFWLNMPNNDEYILGIYNKYLKEKGTPPTSDIIENSNNNIINNNDEII